MYTKLKAYKRFTITSALPYANGPLHIGHIAGAYLPADIFVRYLRLQGADLVYICGSDEHGVAITLKAKKEGTTPQAIIDQFHALNKSTFQRFGISFDMYHRTSEPIHHETSQGFFSVLHEKGEFLEKVSDQFYDEEYNQFLADRYIVGTCPTCGFDNAYGDQCEKCGSSLNPTDLIAPRSMLSGKPPVMRETKHWYLPLDKYQPWLEQWLLEGKKGEWKTNVYGQCSSWLKEGLQPRAMTRDLDWGVDVPLPDTDGKKLYVWLDAPIGYISATKQWAIDEGKDWEKYWKKQPKTEDDTCLIHFIGKDNIVFHCIIFPAILQAHGQYVLPENVPANEFLNLEGDKLSTSRNWAVWLHEYLDEFPGKEDVLRYALCSMLPETKDSEFTWKDFQARNNNELVAILGNFINRAVVLTQKYFDGLVPQRGPFMPIDEELVACVQEYPEKIGTAIEQFHFREAAGLMMDVARMGNKYLAETEPWKLAKTDMERVATILHLSLQVAGALSVLCKPLLPFTSDTLSKMLSLQAPDWRTAGSMNLVASGTRLNQVGLLFEKIDDELVDRQTQKLLEARKQKEMNNNRQVTPAKESATYDDFMKMDIRVATIIEAEKVEKSNKLLKLKVDTGVDVRTVVSGIAQHFGTDQVVGKQVTILLNLAPRKIMGIESQGMILLAENSEGKLVFITPEEGAQPGDVVS
jgi:methionyl-tRNA synthetase